MFLCTGLMTVFLFIELKLRLVLLWINTFYLLLILFFSCAVDTISTEEIRLSAVQICLFRD